MQQPKCLVSINGTAFIDILLDSYISHGITRFIICVGYLKDQIINHLKGKENCEIIFSIEDHPIGTGGAIKKAKRYINSKMFIIANGDSICNIDYLKVIKFHKHNNSDFSMVLSENDSRDDAGNVKIDKDNMIGATFLLLVSSPVSTAWLIKRPLAAYGGAFSSRWTTI